MTFSSPGLGLTTSLKRGKSSYDKLLKKGRATLTLLNFVFIYSINSALVKVVSIASVVSTFYLSVIVVSIASVVSTFYLSVIMISHAHPL